MKLFRHEPFKQPNLFTVEFVENNSTLTAMTNRKAAAVSMEPDLFERAKKRAKDLGFPTFSAYMTQLLRADLIARGDLTLRETPTSPVPEKREDAIYPKSKKPASK